MLHDIRKTLLFFSHQVLWRFPHYQMLFLPYLSSQPNLSNFVAETPNCFLSTKRYLSLYYLYLDLFCSHHIIISVNTVSNKCFRPLMTYLSPFLTAVVRIPATSLLHKAVYKAPILSPEILGLNTLV
jgi:hypothetical protein